MTPAAPPAEKKTNPLVWVAVGCGVIAVLGFIAFAAVGWFAKRQLDKFGENPAIAAAELAVRANPELEVVDSDPEAGTLTIRNKKTGEVVTWNAEDLQEGKFSITTSEGTATFEGAAEGEEGGSFKITTDKGEQATFSAGQGEPRNLPSWLPTYPGGKFAGQYDATSGQGRSVAFTVTTPDSVDQVLAFYETALKEQGLPAQKSTFESDGKKSGSIVATSADRKRTVSIMVAPGDAGQTTAVVSLSETP